MLIWILSFLSNRKGLSTVPYNGPISVQDEAVKILHLFDCLRKVGALSRFPPFDFCFFEGGKSDAWGPNQEPPHRFLLGKCLRSTHHVYPFSPTRETRVGEWE